MVKIDAVKEKHMIFRKIYNLEVISGERFIFIFKNYVTWKSIDLNWICGFSPTESSKYS